MTIDLEHAMRLEAVKTEQDADKKFIMYFAYLQDKLRSTDGTIVDVDVNKLSSNDREAFIALIDYLKSLNENNCNLEDLSKKSTEIITLAKRSQDKNFISWIINEATPLSTAKYINLAWTTEDPENLSIKSIKDITLEKLNEEGIY